MGVLGGGGRTLLWRQLAEIYFDGRFSLPLALDRTFLAIVRGPLFSDCGAFLGFTNNTLFLDIVILGVCAGRLCCELLWRCRRWLGVGTRELEVWTGVSSGAWEESCGDIPSSSSVENSESEPPNTSRSRSRTWRR